MTFDEISHICDENAPDTDRPNSPRKDTYRDLHDQR